VISISNKTNQKKRYFIEFYDSSDKELVKSFGGIIKHDFNSVSELMSAELTSEQVEKLIKHNKIKNIKLVGKCKGSSQYMDWGYTETKVNTRYRGIYTGNNVKVAIIDSGIEHHEDLIDPYEWIDYVNNVFFRYDDYGHGTFIAGIISGQDNTVGYIGVAPNVTLYVAKVLDENNFGYVDDFIAGIDWAISHDVDIINFSIVSEIYDQYLVNATRRAYDAGIIVVACSGNGTWNSQTGWDMIAVNTLSCPAIDYSCVSVGSIDIYEERSSFSNYGDGLDLVAPGEYISSTYNSSYTSYAGWSGTSFATAYVTGHLAILKEKYPSYSRSQLVSKLLSNCKSLGDSYQYGAGLVMAELALPSTPSSPPTITSRIEGGFNLSWGTSTYATSYTLRYKNYDGIYHTIPVSGTTYTLTGLQYGVTHFLSVKGDNASGSSEYTPINDLDNPGTTTAKSPGNLTNPAKTYNTIDVRIADGMSGNWDYIRVYAYNNGISPSYKDISYASYQSGTRIVTWTNLSAGLQYRFNARTYYTYNTVALDSVYWSNDLYVTTTSRPSLFNWTQTELDAFNNNGNINTLTYLRWNEFVDNINLVRVYKGYSPIVNDSAGRTVKMTSNDKTLYATRFNAVRLGIGEINSTGITNKVSGDTVYGNYFVTLCNKLNEIS